MQEFPKKSGGEQALSLLSGGVSSLPVVGGAISRVVDEYINNGHEARVALFVSGIADRVGSLEEKLAADELRVFEQGYFASLGAKSKMHLEWLINCVVEGLSEDRAKKINAVFLIKILRELDEVDMFILMSLAGRSDGGRLRAFLDGDEELLSYEVVKALRFERLAAAGLLGESGGRHSLTKVGRILIATCSK